MTGIPPIAWQSVQANPPPAMAQSPFQIGTELFLTQNGLSQPSTFAFPNVSSDTVVGQMAPQTLEFKTMDALLNTFAGIYQSPHIKRTGGFEVTPTITAGGTGYGQGFDGLLSPYKNTASSVSEPSWDNSYGLFERYTSAATSNSEAGIIWNTSTTAIGTVVTNQATRAIARVRLNQTVTQRLYFGWTSNTALPISDTVLGSSDQGVLIGYNQGTESGGTAQLWSVFNNDGTGTAVTQSLGIGNADTNWHLLQIYWIQGGTQISVQVDANNPVTLTTRIPQTGVGLYFACVGQTSANSAITFDIHAAFVETAG
jgi:hypothetical protein